MQDVTGNLFHKIDGRFIPIHAPRVGCDDGETSNKKSSPEFQSTHPVWDATIATKYQHTTTTCFNPRIPCGMRRHYYRYGGYDQRFQSTHPVWDATPHKRMARSSAHVSIHAPRAGCDEERLLVMTHLFSFNPRTPCGMRLFYECNNSFIIMFQSTHPVRDATPSSSKFQRLQPVSIHAPRAGCDVSIKSASAATSSFNPRTPCGMRLFLACSATSCAGFQSTHPVRDATLPGVLGYFLRGVSIHAPRAGCDLHVPRRYPALCGFNPRTPCGMRRLGS